MTYNFLVLCVLNGIMFITFGYDKLMAIRKGRRVPEFILLLLPFVFSGLGSALGMLVFNNKTSKLLFRILIPLSVFINLPCLYYYFV